MIKNYNFLLAGVGGQGTILASNVLADVGLAAGLDVKKSEVHGMAQRGGSVNTHVRWNATQVFSPLIGMGEADAVLVFERAEAVRYIEYLKSGGLAIIDSEAIRPITVTSGGALYPSNEEVETVYRQATEHLCMVPGAEIARSAGNARAANIVLLGALSAFLDLPEETWLKVIAGRVPAKYLELNRQAFLKGREAACSR